MKQGFIGILRPLGFANLEFTLALSGTWRCIPWAAEQGNLSVVSGYTINDQGTWATEEGKTPRGQPLRPEGRRCAKPPAPRWAPGRKVQDAPHPTCPKRYTRTVPRVACPRSYARLGR